MSISALSLNTPSVQHPTNNTSSDSQKIQNLEQQKKQLQEEVRRTKQNESLDKEARCKKIEELEKHIEKINEQIRKLKQSNKEDKNMSPKNEMKEKNVRDPYSEVGRMLDEIV